MTGIELALRSFHPRRRRIDSRPSVCWWDRAGIEGLTSSSLATWTVFPASHQLGIWSWLAYMPQTYLPRLVFTAGCPVVAENYKVTSDSRRVLFLFSFSPDLLQLSPALLIYDTATSLTICSTRSSHFNQSSFCLSLFPRFTVQSTHIMTDHTPSPCLLPLCHFLPTSQLI